MDPSARRELLTATRHSLPIWVGVTPFGLIFGLLARQTELGVWGALAMSVFVFAGSSQFIAVGLLQAGTSYGLIVLTTLVVNLRHLLYGASVAPHIHSLSAVWQRLLAFGLTDESYAITIARYAGDDGSGDRRWYFLGANANIFTCWLLSTALGAWLGDRIVDPAALGLDFALSATFIGLLIPHMRDKAATVVLIVSGSVALLARHLPGRLSILLAVLLAATAGLLWDRLTCRDHPEMSLGHAQAHAGPVPQPSDRDDKGVSP